MRVMSAFFADHVSTYEQKLFVQGGVWDRYTVGRDGFPVTKAMTLALILQVGADDLGHSTLLTVRIVTPDGSEAEPITVNFNVPADYATEHMCMPLTINVPLAQTGRHVFILDTGSVMDAFSVPLKVVSG